jgi:O-antigen/teichoic acid export membrane protein
MRLLQRLRHPTILLSLGLALSAAAMSAFLAIVNPHVSGADVVALSSLYALLGLIGTGVMAGLEQEMTRQVSRSIAVGVSPAKVVRKQFKQGAWLSLGTVLVVAALSPYLVDQYLHGRWYLLVELLIGLSGTWLQFLVCGLLSGRQDFHLYAITLIVQGTSRLVPSFVLLLLGSSSAWLFGLFFALGPAFAALAGVIGLRVSDRRAARAQGRSLARLGAQLTEDDPGGGQIPDQISAQSSAQALEQPRNQAQDQPQYNPAEESTRRAASNLVMLTLATLASQVIMNAARLLVSSRYGADTALEKPASAVATAFGLAGIALLALFPMQAPLLPKLAAAAIRGDLHEVRRRTRMLVVFCLAAGVAGIVVSYLLGPWLLLNIMRAKAPLPGSFMATLAAGTMFLMLAFVLQSALLALGRHRMVLIAWCLGVVAIVPTDLLAHSLLTTAAGVTVTGPTVAAVIMGVVVVRATGGGAQNMAAPAAEPSLPLEHSGSTAS